MMSNWFALFAKNSGVSRFIINAILFLVGLDMKLIELRKGES